MFLVTGGAGFIGSNVVAALAARGEEVVVCDWLRDDDRWRNLAKHEIADIITPESLHTWLRRHHSSVEAIVHMGAISATTEKNVDAIMGHNVRATLDLVEFCAAAKIRLIYASSAATYGDGQCGFDDESTCAALARLRPLNAYGWSKHLVDRRMARLAERQAPLPPQWVGLKFFNVYGPNEYHKADMRSIVAKNFAAIRAGEPLRLFRSGRAEYPDGGQMRDFVHVDDGVNVILWLIGRPDVSGLFNVGTGRARSWLDLAKALFEAAGRPCNIEFIDMPQALARKYQYFTEAPMSRLRTAGYEGTFTSLEDGISGYVRDYLVTDDPYR
jgi:ADP-L-glycero-D-manno-heptose 6-epimerase